MQYLSWQQDARQKCIGMSPYHIDTCCHSNQAGMCSQTHLPGVYSCRHFDKCRQHKSLKPQNGLLFHMQVRCAFYAEQLNAATLSMRISRLKATNRSRSLIHDSQVDTGNSIHQLPQCRYLRFHTHRQYNSLRTCNSILCTQCLSNNSVNKQHVNSEEQDSHQL